MTVASEQEARRERALEMHLAGAGYAYIGKVLGCSTTTAFESVQDALKARTDDPSMTEAVSVELLRLDQMLQGLWLKARAGDVAAIDRVLRIGERRTQLLTMTQSTATPERVSEIDEFTARAAARRAAAASPDRTTG